MIFCKVDSILQTPEECGCTAWFRGICFQFFPRVFMAFRIRQWLQACESVLESYRQSCYTVKVYINMNPGWLPTLVRMRAQVNPFPVKRL